MKGFALALVGVVVFGVSTLRADVLWDQPWDGVSRGSPAQEFTDTDNRIYSVWLFDDFTVPQPGWWIERVTVYGSEQGTPSYNLGVLLSISSAPRADAINVVATGTEVVLEPGGAPLRRRANLVFEVSGFYLPPGRYYLSAWVRRPFEPGGQWFWLRTSPAIGEPFYLHNPAGGWGFGGDPVGGGWFTEQDLSFTIEGRSTITVAGTVHLEEYGGDKTVIPVTIELREPGSTSVLETHVVNLDSEGRYSFQTLLQGTYDLSAKASHWLRQTLPDVTLTAGTVVDFSLANGDIDGDNEVTLFDFGALVAAFGAVPGDGNWNPDADLDGDEDVTLFDFGILVRNFGAIGDE
ncbi:MAG: hypothetical protein RMM08_08820 [Armatimonadota bacterium]|nr:hypothetical protein [bacterium]MDW8321453.1 hypothetical protein [Armatimonadota bacterium]